VNAANVASLSKNGRLVFVKAAEYPVVRFESCQAKAERKRFIHVRIWVAGVFMSSCEKCGHEIKNYGIFQGGIRCRNYCNMSEHGGKREGAGRKASRGEAKVTTSIGVTPEVKRYLDQCEESQSDVIEDAIRRTKAFREWKAKSG